MCQYFKSLIGRNGEKDPQEKEELDLGLSLFELDTLPLSQGGGVTGDFVLSQYWLSVGCSVTTPSPGMAGSVLLGVHGTGLQGIGM